MREVKAELEPLVFRTLFSIVYVILVRRQCEFKHPRTLLLVTSETVQQTSITYSSVDRVIPVSFVELPE